MGTLNLSVPYLGDTQHICHADGCDNQVRQDDSMGFSVGISHYKDGKKSYIQVHDDQHCCSHDCAVQAIHARIDQHKDLPHGIYDQNTLNPRGLYSHQLVQANAEYHDNPRFAPLPASCCLADCGKSLTDESYLPHVDYSRPGIGPGDCYQAVLQRMDNNRASLEQYDLGACSLDHAIQAAHAIVDEVLVPHKEYRGKPVSSEVPATSE